MISHLPEEVAQTLLGCRAAKEAAYIPEDLPEIAPGIRLAVGPDLAVRTCRLALLRANCSEFVLAARAGHVWWRILRFRAISVLSPSMHSANNPGRFKSSGSGRITGITEITHQ